MEKEIIFCPSQKEVEDKIRPIFDDWEWANYGFDDVVDAVASVICLLSKKEAEEIIKEMKERIKGHKGLLEYEDGFMKSDNPEDL